MFHGLWLVKVLIFPYSWRRLANIECLIKHGCFLPDPHGRVSITQLHVCSKAAAPSQGWCWDGVRTRFSPWPVLPYALSQVKQWENIISAPLFPLPPIYLSPPPTQAMALQTAVRAVAPSMVWFYCKKIYSSLLLQDQGDTTLQINKGIESIWPIHRYWSPTHIAIACFEQLLEELQPRLHNTKLQDILLGRLEIAVNSLVSHKSFPPFCASHQPLAVRRCHPWSSTGIN